MVNAQIVKIVPNNLLFFKSTVDILKFKYYNNNISNHYCFLKGNIYYYKIIKRKGEQKYEKVCMSSMWLCL